jgi:hypothetical protein
MDYSKKEFFNLAEAVEAQGGEHLDEMCKSHTYEFSGKKIKPVTLAGCGNSALFEIPYEALDKRGKDMGAQPITVCAVDDDMGRWPRFGGDRFGVTTDDA